MINAVVALALFTLRRMVAGKRFVSGVVIMLVPPVIAAIVGGLSKEPRVDFFHDFMIEMGTYLVPLLLSLIYAIAFTSGEIGDGTASMVMLAALPRWLVTLVQALVTGAGLALGAALSIAACWAAMQLAGTGEPLPALLIWRYAIAAAVATYCYLGVFSVFGYAFRRGTGASIAVAVAWEIMQVRMPIKFAAYTITNNVRALIVALGLEGERGEHFGYATGYDFPTYDQAALFLSVVFALSLTAAMIAASRRPLLSGDTG